MREHLSKANDCAIFRVLSKKSGEAASSCELMLPGREPCGHWATQPRCLPGTKSPP